MPDVAVLDGVTTTQDFALTAVPNVTVHGTVRDGSGHGWPLYAKVQVPGTPAVTYTDPKTGAYSLTVPQAPSYDIEVDSAYAGYQQATRQIDASSGDVPLDFDVPVDATTCAAPGYRFTYTGSTQPFDGTSAPAGWSVRNAAGTAHGFEFDNPGGLPNNTGGSGNFAVADGYHYGSYLDTSLVSPVMDLSADTTPVVQWNQDLEDFDGTTATVDLSIDGGATWTNVFSSSGPSACQARISPRSRCRARPGSRRSRSGSTTPTTTGNGGGRSTTPSSATASASQSRVVSSSGRSPTVRAVPGSTVRL